MILRIRHARSLLTTCGLPLGAVQVGLLCVSVFLHAPGDADATVPLAPGLHQHHFRLISGTGALVESPAPCLACSLERNPAAIPPLLPAVATTRLECATETPCGVSPARRPTLSTSPRAPPVARR